jgi:uncharacterized membrane protein
MLLNAAAGTPSLSATLQRAATFANLAGCDSRIGEPLDLLTSPAQLAIGSAATRYYRGAIVGNVFIIWCGVAVVAVLLAAATVMRTRARAVRLRAVLGHLRLPGVLIAFYFPLLQPTMISAVVLLRYPSGAADAALGAVSVVAAVSPAVLCSVVLGPLFRVHAPVPVRREREQGASRIERIRSLLAEPSIEYVDTDRRTHFAAMHGPLFEGYRAGCHWFLCAELVAELLLGVVGGVIPAPYNESVQSCVEPRIGMTVVVSAMVLLMLAVRPHVVLLDAATSWANALVVLVGCVLMVTYGTGPVAAMVGVIQFWAAVVIAVLPLVLAIGSFRFITALELISVKIFAGVRKTSRNDIDSRQSLQRLRGPPGSLTPMVPHEVLALVIECICQEPRVSEELPVPIDTRAVKD